MAHLPLNQHLAAHVQHLGTELVLGLLNVGGILGDVLLYLLYVGLRVERQDLLGQGPAGLCPIPKNRDCLMYGNDGGGKHGDGDAASSLAAEKQLCYALYAEYGNFFRGGFLSSFRFR